MTEAADIRKDVANLEYPSIPLNYHPTRGKPASAVLSDKRRMLDRWTSRIKTSNLPGNNLAVEHLREKYIKNLSLQTIDNRVMRSCPFYIFLIHRGVQY